jgi:hypothetical protein
MSTQTLLGSGAISRDNHYLNSSITPFISTLIDRFIKRGLSHPNYV